MGQSRLIQLLSESAAHFSWFLGAGSSQSAGLPTAIDIMWDLKRRHYCVQENQQISSNDVQNVAVREKITAYMEAHSFLPPGDPDEYSACFELIFGADYERQRRYLRAILSDDRISLSIGHRVLAAMMSSGRAKTVFTTNFDTVIEKAVAAVAGKDITPFHIEGSYAANNALNSDEFPIYTKLHGDFRYQSVKNLAPDLLEQDRELGKCMVNACNRFGLVVVGYSGRDKSVMALLQNILDGPNPFPHGLFWTTLKGRKVLKPVDDLTAAALTRGVKAEIVEIETFDSLMSRLWRQLPDRAPALVAEVNKSVATIVNLPMPAAGSASPILRMNGLPIVTLPKECFELHFRSEQEWGDLRLAEGRANGAMICTKESAVWAWGHEAHICKAFGPEILKVTTVNIGDRIHDLSTNLYLKGFVEQGIATALARGQPLLLRSSRSGSTLIIDRHAQLSAKFDPLRQNVAERVLHGQVSGLMTSPTDNHPKPEAVYWAEAVHIDLQEVNDRFWLLLKPGVWIWPKWARKEAMSFLDARLGGRFNRQADGLLSAWVGLLVPSDRHGVDHELIAFDGTEGPGNPRFVLNDRTAFSRRTR
jgi:SIR2-like domain